MAGPDPTIFIVFLLLDSVADFIGHESNPRPVTEKAIGSRL